MKKKRKKKENGTGHPMVRVTQGNGFERHQSTFDDIEKVVIEDGITIIAAEDGEVSNKVVYLFVKVPGVNLAPRITFRRHEMLTDLIEQLMGYRKEVFPDAPEIDMNAAIK